MSPTQNQNNSSDFNVLSEIMERLRTLDTKIDSVVANQTTQATRADLLAYVLKEVFEVEIKRLDGKDERQQEDIDGLKERELTSGQRMLAYIGVGIGSLTGVLSLIHSFIR